jgi:hypothetical protein
METTVGRHSRTFLRLLFVLLVITVSAERRLGELKFDWSGAERIENDEAPEADEILKRLILLDDTVLPSVPPVAVAFVAGFLSPEPCSLCLFVGRPSNPRAPPSVLLSRVG